MPVGSDRTNHRQDQSVLNLVIAASGWEPKVHSEPGFWAYLESDHPQQQVTGNETHYNNVILFSRRGNEPKPYIRHIRTCRQNIDNT